MNLLKNSHPLLLPFQNYAVAGKAGAMGKLEAVATAAPKAGGIKGGFSPSLAISSGFKQFGSPTFVLKKPVVCR